MKENIPLEIERKWLIVRPDEASLAAWPGGERSEIVQTYLVSRTGETRRVRARTRGGVTVYTCTVKRRLSAMAAEEDERVISAGEYAALLAEADPTCRPIEKVRWRLPWGALCCEVDLYPFWSRQAVLEIELPEVDCTVELPAALRVIAEVTGVRGYSNHALARTIPEEHDV